MATFPTDLNACVMWPSYGGSTNDQTIRSQTDQPGHARVRRVTQAQTGQRTIAMRLTDAQFTALRTWFYSSTGAAGGSAWFTMSIAIGTGGLVTKECRFLTGRIDDKLLQKNLIWEITLPIEYR